MWAAHVAAIELHPYLGLASSPESVGEVAYDRIGAGNPTETRAPARSPSCETDGMTRPRILAWAVVLSATLLSACTDEDVENFEDALGALFLFFLVLMVVYAVVLVVGVLLITSGVRRLRQAAASGAAGSDDVRWGAWARIGIGGGLLLLLFGPESAASTLGTAAGLGIAALAGWYLWHRPSEGDPAVVRRLAGAVGIVFGTAVVALFVGEGAVTIRTTTRDDPVTPVLPSATDARVSRIDCRGPACDRAAYVAQELVYDASMFPKPVEATTVRPTPDGAEAVGALVVTTGGMSRASREYVDSFEEDGWQWVDSPCPDKRCLLFDERDSLVLVFRHSGAFTEEARLSLVTQAGEGGAIDADVLVNLRVTVSRRSGP